MAFATTTPKYYSSSDSGAPQITANSPASVIAVLSACLVGSGGTAYGSTAAAGWTIAFQDSVNNAIVFQTKGGNKRYLRLGNPATTGGNTNSDYSYFEVRGYNAMTDVNTGTNAFPTVAQQATWRWPYASQAAMGTTTNIPWSIMVSDRFLYVQFQAGNNGSANAYGCSAIGYFGDITSYAASDTMQTILSGFWNNSANILGCPTWSNNTSYYSYVPFKSSDNLGDFNNYCYIYGSATQVYGPYPAQGRWDEGYSPSGGVAGWAGYQGMPNPSGTGQFFFQKAFMLENSTVPGLRGELPGLLIPLHARPFPNQYQLPLGTDTVISWQNQPPYGNNIPSYNIYLNMTTWDTN